jgi:hypothetical protein
MLSLSHGMGDIRKDVAERDAIAAGPFRFIETTVRLQQQLGYASRTIRKSGAADADAQWVPGNVFGQ